jgi:hypothetical protein
LWSKLTLGTFGPLPLLAFPLKIHLFKANTHWHISWANAVDRRSHHLIVDEFHSFTTQSAQAFSSMLSQSRKFELYLCAAHQFWGQANQHLQEALQNTGIEVAFNVGKTDAESTAKEYAGLTLCRSNMK